MNRDSETLLDIARFARLALEFAQETDRTGLADNLMAQSAILHQFLIMGEAVKRLSESFRSEHISIPWSRIAGMRDNLIHDYQDVDLDLVWDAIERDVPALLQYIEPLLPKEE